MGIISSLNEQDAIDLFLGEPTEETFSDLFRAMAPQVIRYFRARACEPSLAEDLSQEVMLTVFRHVAGLRDRKLFRPWVFKIARNALLQHIRSASRSVRTTGLNLELHDAVGPAGDLTAATDFAQWMAH